MAGNDEGPDEWYRGAKVVIKSCLLCILLNCYGKTAFFA